jgi:predicted transcriptional regulator
MTKQVEFIPFMGIVEIDDDSLDVDKKLFFKTQQEVANELGTSRSVVSITERRALKKFKAAFESKFKKDDFI